MIINSKEDYPKVETSLGKLRGYYKKSENGRLYAAYEGIPYALPPIGELRFSVRNKKKLLII
jgi:bile salt-stimulated lipase